MKIKIKIKKRNTHCNNGESGTDQTSGKHIRPVMFVVGDAAHASEPRHHH